MGDWGSRPAEVAPAPISRSSSSGKAWHSLSEETRNYSGWVGDSFAALRVGCRHWARIVERATSCVWAVVVCVRVSVVYWWCFSASDIGTGTLRSRRCSYRRSTLTIDKRFDDGGAIGRSLYFHNVHSVCALLSLSGHCASPVFKLDLRVTVSSIVPS